jgi:ATP-binding cassette subfamily B protein
MAPQVTKLIIAQRISSIKDCDRIMVLNEGRLSGFDTHDNLLRDNKIYQEICALQDEDAGDFDAPHDTRKEDMDHGA